MFTIVKELTISASHHLPLRRPSLCKNVHGHNWKVRVHCRAEKLNEEGMVMDFTAIKEVCSQYDHHNLNDHLAMPTAENLARAICLQVPHCFKVEVHGLGVSNTKLLEQYPFYSADSTSWLVNARYGGSKVLDGSRSNPLQKMRARTEHFTTRTTNQGASTFSGAGEVLHRALEKERGNMGVERYHDLAVAQLRKAPWNYKLDDQAKKEKLKANLVLNGQVENLVVRELGDGTYEVVNGNHRLDAFVELGWEKVTCYNAGNIPLAQAKRLAIELNETYFDSDPFKLASLVHDIATEIPMADLEATMPFTRQELEELDKLTEFDWAQYERRGNQPGAPEDELATIKVVVPRLVYEQWLSWCDRVREALGPESQGRALEIAITEALNIPIESLK